MLMEQLIVMMHIALAPRYKILSKIQFLRQTICSNNYRKILIGLVNSTLYDMDCRESKIRNCYYTFRTVAQGVCKIKVLNYFINKRFNTNINCRNRYQLSKMG